MTISFDNEWYLNGQGDSPTPPSPVGQNNVSCILNDNYTASKPFRVYSDTNTIAPYMTYDENSDSLLLLPYSATLGGGYQYSFATLHKEDVVTSSALNSLEIDISANLNYASGRYLFSWHNVCYLYLENSTVNAWTPGADGSGVVTSITSYPYSNQGLYNFKISVDDNKNCTISWSFNDGAYTDVSASVISDKADWANIITIGTHSGAPNLFLSGGYSSIPIDKLKFKYNGVTTFELTKNE